MTSFLAAIISVASPGSFISKTLTFTGIRLSSAPCRRLFCRLHHNLSCIFYLFIGPTVQSSKTFAAMIRHLMLSAFSSQKSLNVGSLSTTKTHRSFESFPFKSPGLGRLEKLKRVSADQMIAHRCPVSHILSGSSGRSGALVQARHQLCGSPVASPQSQMRMNAHFLEG